jgi:O-antigen ligase
MTEQRPDSSTPMGMPLAFALLAGILVGWSPRYWREAVPIAAISTIGLIWALTARRVELPRQTILIVLLGIWGFIQLALHVTRVPWATTQRSIEWAMSAVCFILGSQILQGRRYRKPFLNLLLWTITALAVEAMLQRYLTPGRVFGIIPVRDNVVGTLYYKNQFAAMMELAAPLALWIVYNGQVVNGGLCFAAMFAATITSESRMGVILVLAEFLVFLILMVLGRRMPVKSLLAVMAGLALLVTGAFLVAGTEAIWIRLREPDAYAQRRDFLNSTLKMIPTHPWQGSGLGTWPNEYPGFATSDSGLYVNEAHNDWAQWASEGGIPFLFLMAALTISLAKPSFQSVWGLGVLSVMIHSYVDYPLRDPALAFLWFTLAGALTRLETRHSRREATA